MNYSVDKSLKDPVFLQLYRQLKRDILAGVYPEGGRLPSKRLLSAELGVSVIPVEQAFALLCDEGYAEARERSGYYATFSSRGVTPGRRGSAFTMPPEAESRPEEPVPFPFPALARTMRRVLTEQGERILVRSPGNGCLELRQSLSDYLARARGMAVSPEQIIIGSGAEYLYSLVVQLLGREKLYALENPSYDKIRLVYCANGVKCDMLCMGSDGILNEELQRTSASVLHITPFHSFPSGVTATAGKRREYIRWAERTGGTIVEDDFDSEFTVSAKAEDTVFSMAGGKQVIYLNTFSETIAPAVRVGYMVLPEELQRAFAEKLSFYSCTVPVYDQLVLAEFIRGGDFERHINRVRRQKRKNQKNIGSTTL